MTYELKWIRPKHVNTEKWKKRICINIKTYVKYERIRKKHSDEKERTINETKESIIAYSERNHESAIQISVVSKQRINQRYEWLEKTNGNLWIVPENTER